MSVLDNNNNNSNYNNNNSPYLFTYWLNSPNVNKTGNPLIV